MKEREIRKPNLEKYLPENRHRYISYLEGYKKYSLPYYSFIKLVKEAGANITIRNNAIVDLDILEKYLATTGGRNNATKKE